jgi:hypothetical protein
MSQMTGLQRCVLLAIIISTNYVPISHRMPALIQPDLKPWPVPKETETDLDWAPLAILDFAKWDTPGGKEQLARDLTDAVRDMGFWVVTNPGVPQEAMDRQFALANTVFSLPEEEKDEVTFVAGVSEPF